MNNTYLILLVSLFIVSPSLADEQSVFRSAAEQWWQSALSTAEKSETPAALLSPIEDVIRLRSSLRETDQQDYAFRKNSRAKERFILRVASDLSRLRESRSALNSIDKMADSELELLEIRCRRIASLMFKSNIGENPAGGGSLEDRELAILRGDLRGLDESKKLDWQIRRALAEHNSNSELVRLDDILKLFRRREQFAKKQFEAKSISIADYLSVQADLLFLEYSQLNPSPKKAGQVAQAYGHLLQIWRDESRGQPLPISPKYCRVTMRRLDVLAESENPNFSITSELTNYLALAQSLEWSEKHADRQNSHLQSLFRLFCLDATSRLMEHHKMLSDNLARHESFRARQQAAMSLAWLLHEGTGALIDAMGHDDIETQKFVRYLVGRQGEIALPDLLTAAATDSREGIRHNAVLAIGYIGPGREGLKQLRNLRNKEKSKLVQTALQGVLDAQKQYTKLPAPKKPELPGIWSPKSFR